MNTLKPLLGIAAVALAAHASAQVTFYEGEHFRGRTFAAAAKSGTSRRRASTNAPRRWSSIADAGKSARTQLQGTLRGPAPRQLRLARQHGHGEPDLLGAACHGRRQYDNEVPTPLVRPNYEYRRRPERAGARGAGHVGARGHGPAGAALLGRAGPGRRKARSERAGCSHRRHPRRRPRPPGRRRQRQDVATIAGAVGGAALGANVDRIRDPQSGREVRRCEHVAGRPPQYWDVTYEYQGVEHRVQMTTPPGPTIAVNAQGEPRLSTGRREPAQVITDGARAPSARARRRSGRRSRSAAQAPPASRRPVSPDRARSARGRPCSVAPSVPVPDRRKTIRAPSSKTIRMPCRASSPSRRPGRCRRSRRRRRRGRGCRRRDRSAARQASRAARGGRRISAVRGARVDAFVVVARVDSRGRSGASDRGRSPRPIRPAARRGC